jgi:plasmid stability protein
MASVEQELRDALTRFMRAAAQKDKEALATALGRVTELQKRLGPDAPEMLRHYLERRSYQKALEFLNSGRPETETPQCGH